MSKKLTEGSDFYYNDSGYVVFTEKYHKDRGYCCGNGCKHCPYEYDCVPEPVKTELMKKNNLQTVYK